jgi:hypothetical protein
MLDEGLECFACFDGKHSIEIHASGTAAVKSEVLMQEICKDKRIGL